MHLNHSPGSPGLQSAPDTGSSGFERIGQILPRAVPPDVWAPIRVLAGPTLVSSLPAHPRLAPSKSVAKPHGEPEPPSGAISGYPARRSVTLHVAVEPLE